MSTNGESARRWLDDNQERVSEERIRQIRDNLAKKIDQISDSDTPSDAHQDLLDALDVMDAWLDDNSPPSDTVPDNTALDYSPLIQEPTDVITPLSEEEKKQRFNDLLKSQ